VASSGSEACELLRRAERVDLVILDLVMPGMDGGETFDRIRAIDPGVPVVLSSGYGDDELAAELATRGARGFIQKPYALEELGRRLHAIVGRR
jgi:two-component system, cell cycle sensor histidine kinase and response regulator CckA